MFNSVERGPASVKWKMDAIKILNIAHYLQSWDMGQLISFICVLQKFIITIRTSRMFLLRLYYSLHHFLETFLIVNRAAFLSRLHVMRNREYWRRIIVRVRVKMNHFTK